MKWKESGSGSAGIQGTTQTCRRGFFQSESYVFFRVFHGRTEFACMQILAKLVDFSFANEKSLNLIEML